MRLFLSTALVATIGLAAPADASDVALTRNLDGSYTVTGEVTDIGEASGAVMSSSTAFATAIGQTFGGAGVDFSEGHVIDGPLTVNVARDDGTVGTYRDENRAILFDRAGTLREQTDLTSMTGVVVVEDERGRLIADEGAVTVTR